MKVTYHPDVIKRDLKNNKVPQETFQMLRDKAVAGLARPLRRDLAGCFKVKGGRTWRLVYREVTGGIQILWIGPRSDDYETVTRRVT